MGRSIAQLNLLREGNKDMDKALEKKKALKRLYDIEYRKKKNKTIICPICKCTKIISVGHYNHSIKICAPLYCSRKCSGLGRRCTKPIEQKIEEKRLYDIEYRANNVAKLKIINKIWFEKDYAANPEKYKSWREDRSERHNEYCRQPKYKEKKHTYDRTRYAKKSFGDMWESHVLVMAINEEIAKNTSKYDIRLQKLREQNY